MKTRNEKMAIVTFGVCVLLTILTVSIVYNALKIPNTFGTIVVIVGTVWIIILSILSGVYLKAALPPKNHRYDKLVNDLVTKSQKQKLRIRELKNSIKKMEISPRKAIQYKTQIENLNSANNSANKRVKELELEVKKLNRNIEELEKREKETITPIAEIVEKFITKNTEDAILELESEFKRWSNQHQKV